MIKSSTKKMPTIPNKNSKKEQKNSGKEYIDNLKVSDVMDIKNFSVVLNIK